MVFTLLQWLLNAVALMLVPELVDGIHIEGFYAALLSALLLGLVNTFVRPLLVLVTLPITVLSLGLFMLVINGLMFWGVAGVVNGFQVTDFGTAFLGALAYSLLTWAVELALGRSGRG
jgi:putative membrane protein